jgi:hypothetical protein
MLGRGRRNRSRRRERRSYRITINDIDDRYSNEELKKIYWSQSCHDSRTYITKDHA